MDLCWGEGTGACAGAVMDLGFTLLQSYVSRVMPTRSSKAGHQSRGAQTSLNNVSTESFWLEKTFKIDFECML